MRLMPAILLSMLSSARLSLNLSACGARAAMVAAYLADLSAASFSPSLPLFSIGIKSIPDLPNILTARAVFSIPSGMALNRSASCIMASSALVALNPAFLSASPCSSRLILTPLMPLASASMVVPLCAAASSYFARSFTAIPVRWDRSFMASAASIIPLTWATMEPTDKPMPNAPSAVLAWLTAFSMLPMAPATDVCACVILDCRSMMSAMNLMLTAPASMSVCP